MQRNYFILFFIIFTTISFAQSSLDAYKYVIIPDTYDFLKAKDKYQLNSLTKFLFSKKGFQTVMMGESYPADLLDNPCLAVKADVKNKSSLLNSKLTIILKDCNDNIVFTSAQGKSKEKDFKKSYQEALRKAFESVDNVDYQYNPGVVVNSDVALNKKQALSQEISKPTSKVVVPKKVESTTQNTKTKSIAKSYKNENISFFLIDQNKSLVAYVNDSKDGSYQKGEMIATLIRTSLPNIYRITFKNKQGKFEDTTGYFDEEGNLKIDFNEDGKIKVRVFELEK